MTARPIDPGQFKTFIELAVRWGDMDALGHVNNAVYFTYFESARIIYFDRIGAFSRFGEEGIGPILASAQCDYLSPLTYPAAIEIGARVSSVGTTSFAMEYLVRHKVTRESCAVGTGVGVMFDYRAKRKVPVPEAMREAIRRVDGV
jgi:acyl-CoA thioester hydrolase